MSDNTLVRQSARELARLIRNRAVSPIEVLDAHLAAIAALNPKLNAIVTLAEESAREHARRVEQAVMKGEPLGALHGLPVGIKDITQTAGIRTTFASPLLKDNVPSEDEEVVRRLKAAGAIVLAKTNTPDSPAARTLTTRCSGRRAIRGIQRSVRPAHRAAPRLQWRPA